MARLPAIVALMLASFVAGLASSAMASDNEGPDRVIATAFGEALEAATPAARRIAVGLTLRSFDVDWVTGSEEQRPPFLLDTAKNDPAADVRIVPLELLSRAPGFPKDEGFFSTLLAAGRTHGSAIILSGGSYNLADIAAFIGKSGNGEFLQAGESGLSINAPLYIGPDASLEIGPEGSSRISLGTSAGAFIVSAGRLGVHDVVIAAEGANDGTGRNSTSQYRPFILIGAGGTINAHKVTFSGLGGNETYPAALILLKSIAHDARRSAIINSAFADGFGLKVEDSPDVTISGNEFRNTSGPAIHISNSTDVSVRGNLIYAISGNHAVLLSEGASKVLLSGNIIARSDSGIAVTSGADDNLISGNIVAANNGFGIGLYGGPCTVVKNNALLGNGGDGISWRYGSADIIGNRIKLNRGAGVSSPTAANDGKTKGKGKAEALHLEANSFSRNRMGLKIDRAAWISLENNLFDNQSPRIVGGKLGSRVVPLLRADGARAVFVSDGSSDFQLNVGDATATPPAACLRGASLAAGQ